MKKWLIIIGIICLAQEVLAQAKVGMIYEELPADSVEISLSVHTAILPKIRQKSLRGFERDTARSFLTVTPLADAGFAYDGSTAYRGGLGVSVQGQLNNKWYLNLNVIQDAGHADSAFFQPKSYVFTAKNNYFLSTDIRGRISYTPNEIFNFQVGLDQQFIGEGSRSFFLSDYGKPYSFAAIRANFWRVEYLMLYQFFREETTSDQWKSKYAATHYLSLNAAKWLNFGIFESVIFQPKDTLLNRGYDVEYLNPVIFFRPQEYSMGSSDNVLLGASFTARFMKKHTLYGQLMMDEFSLAEIKNKTGWWANKYAVQLGIKGRFKQLKRQYFYRIEYNYCRPYTFAHINEGENYGNQGMTLAHPLGANFYELLGELKMQQGKWLAKLFVSYALKGLDKNDGYSYGGNIYQPYDLYLNEFGNYTGQGRGNNMFRLIASVSYLVYPKGNLQVFLENHYRYDSAYKLSRYVPVIGIRSQLWNDYRNY